MVNLGTTIVKKKVRIEALSGLVGYENDGHVHSPKGKCRVGENSEYRMFHHNYWPRQDDAKYKGC